MDKASTSRKCGKVRRTLFHLLLIMGGKFCIMKRDIKHHSKTLRRDFRDTVIDQSQSIPNINTMDTNMDGCCACVLGRNVCR
ncbi:hypothetical protein M0804_002119 [Polistes exclamans]|nr:hypothetical protein M0804_002119 [Polistes exclamans]